MVNKPAALDDDASPFADDDESSVSEQQAGVLPWKVAIVDDEQEVHDVTTLALRGVEFGGRPVVFLSAHSTSSALSLLNDNPDTALLLLDVVMESDTAGLDLVRFIRGTLKNQQLRVVLRTGQPGQAPEAAVIREYDISDYRSKTELTATRLLTTIISALRTYAQLEEISRLKAEIERERDYLRVEVKEASGGEPVVFGSDAFAKVMSQVEAVASSTATALLLGESGVGKEVVARMLHERSQRRNGPLVKVNCASIPKELFESEFFGHVRGAFTGAHKDRVGRFQLADGGTLFLDEVGEIPLDLQGKLLRALQEREVERIGDTKAQKVDVRVVAATNRDLKRAVEEGRFRADLFYRLNVFPIDIPPLRERRGDVVPLFEHFLLRATRSHRRPFAPLTPAQVKLVERYPWPGNVRELENVVERAVILATDGVLRLEEVIPETVVKNVAAIMEEAPRAAPPSAEVKALKPERGFYTSDEMRSLERQNIINALERADWRVAGEGGAAGLLGIKPTTLAYQIRTLGIERGKP